MLKSFWFWFTIFSVAIQFIPVDVPSKLATEPQSEIDAPREILAILKRSCYDCHSSSVDYPWYDKIAPVSWFVKNHVKNGRKVINFSRWKEYSPEKRAEVIRKLPKSLTIRMPMPSYLWLHQDAALSDNDKRIVRRWANDLKKNLK